MSFFSGLAAPLRGLGLLVSNPSLIPLALIPALAGFGASVLGIWAATHFGDQLIAFIWMEPEAGFTHALWTGFTWFMSLTTVLMALFITPWLVMLLGFPLCDPLMMKVDRILGGETVASSFAAEMRRTLASTMGVLAIGLTGAVILALLGLIPGVAVFTVPFATFVWTPIFLAFDAMDPTLGRRQLEFGQKVSVFSRNFMTAVGLGLMGTVLVAIPIVNLLGLPILAIGGVIAVRDLEKKGRI